MAPRLDLKGQKFTRLLVLEDVGRNKHKQVLWECRCDCGKLTVVVATQLRQGKTQSCGCLQKEKASQNTSKDLIGKRFGRLKVLDEHGVKESEDGSRRRWWTCQCDCGNVTEVRTSSLTNGHTQSCGCIQSEMMVDRMSGENHYNYNPDLTTEERLKHRYKLGGFNAAKWRTEVYTRDNHTCQLCGERGGSLQAHHLDGWNWCKEKRFDVSNGTTLCYDCHSKFHLLYGNGDNTKEQYEEYQQALV